MHGKAVSTIPAHGTVPDLETLPESRAPFHGYAELLHRFLAAGTPVWEIVYDPTTHTSRGIVESARAVAKREGLAERVRLVRRGSRVFLAVPDWKERTAQRETTPSEREERRRYRREIAELLVSFSLSPDTEATVTVPDGYTPRRVYHALHYKRTALGLGNVSVRYDGETITLHKKAAG